jgi:phosphoserine phosphatase RsbU/P
MNNTNTHQRFTRVLREDLKNMRFGRDVKHEFRELKEFYLNEEQKQRLEGMGRIHGWFHQIIWMIKSLFLHLTPTRRILTSIGLFIVLFGTNVIFGNGNLQINNSGLLGGVIIFIVLMLELKDKLLAKDELEAGRKVQRALTPERSPKVEGWSIWLFTRPANEVGGDLVDYLKINNDRVGIILADVTGKGLHAALLMAKLQATIRAVAADFESLSQLVTKINSIFYRDSLPNIFASMVYIEIKPENPQLRFVNAGHFPPILIKNGNVKETQKRNTAIGLTKDFSYTADEITVDSGEILIAYSDGVTEARNELGQFFERERFLKILPQVVQRNFEDIGEAIVNEIDRFVGDAPVNDDLSLMIIRKE